MGYYGGVNYGFGFGGIGFAGGEWRGGNFAYNTAVMHVNETIIHTTYVNRTIVEAGIVANPNHVAYNGGPHGIQHAPTAAEQAAAQQKHTPPTASRRSTDCGQGRQDLVCEGQWRAPGESCRQADCCTKGSSGRAKRAETGGARLHRGLKYSRTPSQQHTPLLQLRESSTASGKGCAEADCKGRTEEQKPGQRHMLRR